MKTMASFHRGVQCIRHFSTEKRRVVVTGVGLVTCLGVGTETVWSRLLQGRCGLGKVQGKDYGKVPCQVAGFVPTGDGADEFSRQRFIPKSQDRGVSLAASYALAAAEEALTSARWMPDDNLGLERTGFRGPNHAVSTACATGLHAIGDASRFIRYGDADVMVAGGVEASVGPLAMAGFARMRALSTSFNHSPHEASRPFDARRDGFVMSEGAGLVVLEELTHAQQRGATILGEVLGYGLSGDAHHITTPSESGSGARRCMQAALRDAGVSAEAVGHVNAHATSTPIGDAVESRAIQEVLGKEVLVTSIKGALGHLLGAAGSVEAITALLSCQTGLVPPTLNLSEPDTGCDLNYVTGSPRPWVAADTGRRIALTNSFGFGGTNASLCVGEFVSQ